MSKRRLLLLALLAVLVPTAAAIATQRTRITVRIVPRNTVEPPSHLDLGEVKPGEEYYFKFFRVVRMMVVEAPASVHMDLRSEHTLEHFFESLVIHLVDNATDLPVITVDLDERDGLFIIERIIGERFYDIYIYFRPRGIFEEKEVVIYLEWDIDPPHE